MGQYKVIQDIEAEDKLFGPFSLRQFIYLIIVIVCGFVAFKLLTIKWFMAIPFLPPIAFFGLLAAPFGHSQSSEVWLLAKIRFALKPRRRVWDQSGIKEFVTITVPKKVERHLTKGFSQDEVESRLKALANTIDTRGWAVKNIETNLYNQQYAYATPSADRLIDMPQYSSQPTIEDSSGNDVLDEYSNPNIQNIDMLMANAEQAHHQQLVSMMQQSSSAVTAQAPPQQPIEPQQQWFAQPEPQTADAQQSTPIQPIATSVISQPVEPTVTPDNTMTQPPDTAILELANNDDLSVATIARQADKAVAQSDDEVVVSLR
jgi:hypothetical protein